MSDKGAQKGIAKIFPRDDAGFLEDVKSIALDDEMGVANVLDELRVMFAQRFGVSYPPIPMRLTCPACGELHVDEGEFEKKTHHTHACQHCGNVWRPAVIATVGVRFLPGFRNP